ncbi:hypothetical protein PBRA_009353 [Plasmodiophora brassicae]|uniref:Uncharacterized protein n=1 Tax=Plasmodiophora brassicae TaxID=37360 RepID=A0A0G4J6G0_PLABS|nr:hypothetical protein PBRA_009353 [Plasmodiophora brassicae]
MLRFVVVTACLLPGMHSALVIIQPALSPFAGIRTRSVPQNRYLGPQGTDAVIVNVTAEFMVVNSDTLCVTNRDVPDEARGRIVFLVSGAGAPLVGCPVSVVYSRLDEKGVAAWIIIFPNGQDVTDPIEFYHRNSGMLGPGRNAMLFVEVEEPAQPGTSLVDYLMDSWQKKDPIVISVRPDVNDWDDFYPRWYIQVLLRWIPTVVFGFACVLAARFLGKHLTFINAEFDGTLPAPSMRTRRRRIKFIASRLSIVHLILVIELVTTPALCAFIGIGGWGSNDILPHEMTLFFLTGLSGWGFTCDVLSAVFWTSIIKEIPGSGRGSWFGRLLDRHYMIKVAFCVLPVTLDTVACLLNVLYVNVPYDYLLTAALIMILQRVVGIQFLPDSHSAKDECSHGSRSVYM